MKKRINKGGHLPPITYVVNLCYGVSPCFAVPAGGERCARAVGFDRFHLFEGASFSPWRQRGAKAQAIGPSRGGRTKIHAVIDLLGRPAVLRLTPGNVADITMGDDLLDAAGPICCLLADKGHDANSLRKRRESKAQRQ